MQPRSGEELTELEARQEPRFVKSLEMVAPGTAVREGIDNIVHARTGGLIVIGDPDELAFLFSRRDQAGHRLHAGAPLPAREDGRRDRAQRERDQDRVGQRPADARPDDPLVRDRHAPPHRRARVQADRRAGHRGLAAPRRRLALRRRREVHPRGDPGRAGQGQPGPGHARQVPHPARPGLHAPHRPRVRGRRHASRRARPCSSAPSSSRAWRSRSSATSSSSAPKAG